MYFRKYFLFIILAFIFCIAGFAKGKINYLFKSLDELLVYYKVKDIVVSGNHTDTILYANNDLVIWFRNISLKKGQSFISHPVGTTPGAIYIFSKNGYLKTIPTDTPWQPDSPKIVPFEDNSFFIISYLFDSKKEMFRRRVQIHCLTPKGCFLIYEKEFIFLENKKKENKAMYTCFDIYKNLYSQFILFELQYEHKLNPTTKEVCEQTISTKEALIWNNDQKKFTVLNQNK